MTTYPIIAASLILANPRVASIQQGATMPTIHERRAQLRRIDLFFCRLFQIKPGPDPHPAPGYKELGAEGDLAGDATATGIPALRWLASNNTSLIEFLNSMHPQQKPKRPRDAK